MSKDALTGGEVDVCGDESSYLGIVVTGLEVVEAGFLVIDVTSIAERLFFAEGVCKRA